MTSLFYGVVTYGGVPADENTVRMTTAPVTPDAPPAMAENAPDFNEVETDRNPMLGMATRQLASTWHDSQKYAPGWIDAVSNGTEHNAIVNRQVSSSGTAAQRESSGQFGHGTMAFAEGIEPVIRDGAQFGNEYFKTNDRSIQDTAGDYMTTPPGMDQNTSEKVSATGKNESRQAVQSSAYKNMWDGIQNGL